MSEEHKSASYRPPPCLILKVDVQMGPDAVQRRDQSYLHAHFENHAELRALRCRFVSLRHLPLMSFCQIPMIKLYFDCKRQTENMVHS